MRNLDFKDKSTHEINQEELESSVKETFPNGGYQNGIRHVDLMKRIIFIIQAAGFNPEVKTCYVSNAGSKQLPGVTREQDRALKFGENDVRSFIFRRILVQIDIPDLQTNEIISSVVFAYHQQGIQIAIGPNVKACSNMSIMSPQFSIASFGRSDKITDIEDMISVFSNWIANLNPIWKRDQEIIEAMKSTMVTEEDIQRIIGLMTLRRVAREKFGVKETEQFPLNNAQINKFSAEFLNYRNSYKQKKVYPLWDVYNMGTELHKANEMDLSNVMDQNVVFGNILCDYFNIDTNYSLNEKATINIQKAEVVNDIEEVKSAPGSLDVDDDWADF